VKVTKNFFYYEFGPSRCAKTWIPDNDYQKEMVANLATNLQILRNIIKAPINVTSGARTMTDFYRLQGAGYHPSETSDHFYGVATPIKKGGFKYQKFGPTYNFSTGAADCIPETISVKKFFEIAMRAYVDSKVKFGQIIYEKDPVRKVEWVHFSNCYEHYFSEKTVNWLGKKVFLQSLDGGKTYKTASL